MISKELLSHSLHSSYRELLSSKIDDSDFLKKEIVELAENAEIFSEKEIKQHKEAFLLMEKLSLKNKISCHVDGSVRIVYEKKSDSLLKKRVVGAGAAYIIESEGEILSEQGVPLPISFMEEDMTSHIAEYHAPTGQRSALSHFQFRPAAPGPPLSALGKRSSDAVSGVAGDNGLGVATGFVGGTLKSRPVPVL